MSLLSPTAGARLAAWWSGAQWIVYLLVLLAASLALNAWQWKRSITAPLREEVDSKSHALADSAALLKAQQDSAQRLQAAADAVADRLAVARRDYVAAVRERPLDNAHCAPGKARVDAVNRAAGADQE